MGQTMALIKSNVSGLVRQGKIYGLTQMVFSPESSQNLASLVLELAFDFFAFGIALLLRFGDEQNLFTSNQGALPSSKSFLDIDVAFVIDVVS